MLLTSLLSKAIYFWLIYYAGGLIPRKMGRFEQIKSTNIDFKLVTSFLLSLFSVFLLGEFETARRHGGPNKACNMVMLFLFTYLFLLFFVLCFFLIIIIFFVMRRNSTERILNDCYCRVICGQIDPSRFRQLLYIVNLT